MSLFSFLSKVRIRNYGTRWTSAQYLDAFQLYRFPTAPLEDGEGDPYERLTVRGCCDKHGVARYLPSVRTILLIFGTFSLGVVFMRIIDSFKLSPFTTNNNNNLPWVTATAWPVLPFDSDLYFPAQGSNFFPRVASYNLPPRHRPRTPMFIPFTRNNAMMRQAVLGYIASGWPREDIIIVDNSGTFDANSRKLLSDSNPFFLDYDLFRYRYGVSILQTPTLLNFAQMQNFFLRLALNLDWPYYFWSHMDVGILSRDEMPYKSFYQRVLDIILEAGVVELAGDKGEWGMKMFRFDNLALVNVAAWRQIGQWDVFVPYYATDCDAYARLKMLGYRVDNVDAGYIWDVADYVRDPEAKFFPPSSLTNSTPGAWAGWNRDWNSTYDEGENHGIEGLNSTRFNSLREEFQKMQDAK